MGLPMWGSEGFKAHRTPESSSQSNSDQTVQPPAARLPSQESVVSSAVTTSVNRPEDPTSTRGRGTSASRIFGPRDPQIASSSQSIEAPSSGIPHSNGRAAGVTDASGVRGVLRQSDDRDEQMLSLEEFLAESSRATARRAEEDAFNLAASGRSTGPERRATSTTGTGSLRTANSNTPGSPFRQNLRPWRQLPRGDYRTSLSHAMARTAAEVAAVQNWNNFAREHGAHARESHTHIHAQSRSSAAGASGGFHDIVQQIRDIGAHQDRALEGTPDDPRLREPAQSLIERARLGLLHTSDTETELFHVDIQADRDAQQRDSTSFRPISDLLQEERNYAIRLEQEMEDVDHHLRNLHREYSARASDSSTRLLSYIRRTMLPPPSPPTLTFNPPYRTVRPGVGSATPPIQGELSATIDSDRASNQPSASDPSSELSRTGRSWVGPPSEPQDNPYDPDFVLRFRNHFTQLSQPETTIEERLQVQLDIQNLFDRRNSEYDFGSSSVEIRPEITPRFSQGLINEGRQRRPRHITGNYNDPVSTRRVARNHRLSQPAVGATTATATATPVVLQAENRNRFRRHLPDRDNQFSSELYGAFWRQFQSN